LKKETLKTWDEYIQTSSSLMQDRFRPNGQFLWVDEVPERNRWVRAGKILVSPVGQHVPKPVASGLIRDWMAAAFIPDAKLDDVLSAVRDYDRYKNSYTPNVIDSKSLSTDGPAEKFSMLLVNKVAVANTALDGEYEACHLQFTEEHATASPVPRQRKWDSSRPEAKSTFRSKNTKQRLHAWIRLTRLSRRELNRQGYDAQKSCRAPLKRS